MLDAIDVAAEKEGLKKSTWGREVLGACAIGGVTLEDLHALVKAKGLADQSPHPGRQLPLQAQPGQMPVELRNCKHPLTARKQLAFSQLCTVCKQTVKRT